MTNVAAANPLAELHAMLSASKANYDACISHVDHAHTCTGVRATTRLHHLRFDPDGQPKVDALAKCLAEHIMEYTVAARNRPVLRTTQEMAAFHNAARRLFRSNAMARGAVDRSGEAGEMLLYFLLEAVLQAPQVVAKVELKTSPAMEVHGSDGIHMRWDSVDQVVDVFFGESKLYTNVGDALASAFASIETFHARGMREHEIAMVTRHFKGADDNVRRAVAEMLDSGRPASGARINHACLIGYDWQNLGHTPTTALAALEAEYRRQYLEDAPRLHRLLQVRFDDCERRQYGFEVFFLPFTSVQAFRDAFSRAME